MAVVDINQLAILGVSAIVLIAILGTLAQGYLASQAQANLNNIHSQGIQAVIAQNQQDNLADELQETNNPDGSGTGGSGQ